MADITSDVQNKQVQKSYWFRQLLALSVGAMGLLGLIVLGLFSETDSEFIQFTLWGLFWGFAFSFSLVAMGRYVLQPSLFVLSLIRILFFGYCMVVTASGERIFVRYQLLGFIIFFGLLGLTYWITSIWKPSQNKGNETSAVDSRD